MGDAVNSGVVLLHPYWNAMLTLGLMIHACSRPHRQGGGCCVSSLKGALQKLP
jgi:hypothetical protein